MKELDINNLVRIQPESDYWYTVEDIYLDAGTEGITISYYEDKKGRVDYMCFSEEVAIAIADSIYKLVGKKNER